MKIGILTYPLNNNYGCYLQSYALLNLLKEKGYDVEYIYRRHDKPSWRFYIIYFFKSCTKIIKTGKWMFPFYRYEWDYMLRNGKNMIVFFEEHIIPHTKALYTSKALKRQCRKYDIVIVGSDQVWRADILSNIEDYFLSFIKRKQVRKIAYAASFGKEDPGYSKEQIQRCGVAVRSFSAVSVRENVGKDIISRYGWKCVPPRVVLDPTMLLPLSSYNSLLEEKEMESVVFGYILDQSKEKSEALYHIARKYRIKAENYLEGVRSKNLYYPSVGNWLNVISNSRFVLTDSFHGVVFSIIFNKPFIVMINEDRGAARFDTLLETFDLKDRVLTSSVRIDDILSSTINWKRVNDILEKRREDSINFLLNNIVLDS